MWEKFGILIGKFISPMVLILIYLITIIPINIILRIFRIDLLKKKATLSKEEYKKKTDELRKRVVDYQNNRRSSLSKLAKERADARALLLKKIDPIIDSYIKEQGIALVIDRKNIIRANKNLDITNIIVEKLNKELPSLNLK